jgi:hypothetical protein
LTPVFSALLLAIEYISRLRRKRFVQAGRDEKQKGPKEYELSW